MHRKILLFALAALAACGDGKPLELDDHGVVAGVAYVDNNGDGQYSAGDAPAPGVQVAVVVDGSADTVARATTGTNGQFVMPNVTIGRYQILAARGTLLGDTLEVLPIDNDHIVVTVADTVIRSIRLGYQTLLVSQLGTAVLGRRAGVQGIALNGWSTFGDSTVHIADATGSVRALRVAPGSFAAGDSVRIVGTVGTDLGRAVLVDATVRILAPARGLPAVNNVSTAQAAAGQGALPYAQVRVSNAAIVDTATVGRDRRLTVDDGSGPLSVLLDADLGLNLASFIPGGTFAATGVLVPLASGSWQLKPRTPAEAVVTFSTVTIAQARAAATGTPVVIAGIALNGTTAFGDSTVHVRDATGSIRTIRVPNIVAGGDSVRMIGTMAVRSGQPVVTVSSASIIRPGVGVGEPDSVSTRTAGNAGNGTLDAAQVRIAGTILGTQQQPNGDFLLIVDDGSGRTDVLFDQNVILPPGAYLPGAILHVRGVLVPSGTGTWRVLPRTASDVLSATFPTVTIAQLRELEAGKRVYIQGIALNGWATFGDSTVHVADATGAVIAYRVPQSTVFAGDSVRILGTVAFSSTQTKVLGATSIEVLLAGAGLPPADSLATLQAGLAAGGAKDAAHVRVAGRVASVQIAPNGDTHLVVNDASGPVGVRLDRHAGFPPGGYAMGDRLNVRGVLVPGGFPAFWYLKPRSPSDLVRTPDAGGTIASYRTSWWEYYIGIQPGDWTPRWDRSTTFLVLEEPAARDGRTLQWAGVQLPRDNWAIAYDGFGDIADQELYTEFRVHAFGAVLPEYLMGVAAVRIAGTAADENGYAVFLRQRSGTPMVQELVLATFVGGVRTDIGTAPFGWSGDTWYSVRMEAVGTQIRAKAWARGDVEPGWMINVTDERYASGKPGIVNVDVGIVQWQVFEARRR